MSDIYVTFICPAAAVDEARAAAAAVVGGADMLQLGLSPTGTAPATHYVSSGWVRPAIRDALASFCVVTVGWHEVTAVIAAAGLNIVTASGGD